MSGSDTLQPHVWNGQTPRAAASAHLTLTSLQYLRGVAALMVVYFHGVLQLQNFASVAGSFPLFGESGVDLFFVLSGLLMWITTARSQTTPWAFMRKRLLRIAPLYWALTIAAGVAALLAPTLLKSTVFVTSHFVSSLLFIPAQNPAFAETAPDNLLYTPVLVPGWTLNYEMFFYLIFALCILLKPSMRLVLIPCAFALLVWAGVADLIGNGPLSYYSNPIIFEFILGMGVGVLVQRRWFLAPLFAVVAAVSAAALLLYADLHHAPLRPLTFGLPAAVIIYCICSLEAKNRTLNMPLLRLLGDASYSIYLTHVFSLAALRIIFLHVSADAGPSALLFLLAALILSAVVGIVTYRLYEKPAMQLLERFK